MSSRLEQFINDHREEFDSEEPSKKIWDKIQDRVDPQPGTGNGKVVSFNFAKWSAAAAVVILAATGIWYFSHQSKSTVDNQNNVAGNTTATPEKANNGLQPPDTTTTNKQPDLAQTSPKEKPESKKDSTTIDPEISDYQEEMVHYAKLVEIKHNQLKRIEKNEPLLYKQFAGDVEKLDKVYHSLEQQLPKNPNREQLLEAMIHNLQLQMKLLNHQLDIIKQINHSKKTEYEKAYQSI